MAGMVRDTRAGSPSRQIRPDAKKPPRFPQVVDRESSQQPPDKKPADPPASKPASKPRLTLPRDHAGRQGRRQRKPAPPQQKVDEAVAKQQDLLAEFEKIADELNRVLANLEGSTLVKRLKAASRMQYSIAGRIIDQVSRRLRRWRLPRGPGRRRPRSSANWPSRKPRQATTSR